MSEYLSKKALLEWLKKQRKEMESECEIDREGAYLDVIEEIQSGVFDVPEMEHINTYWAREGLIKHQKAEIQRLRAAAIKLHETLNTYWQGDCEKVDVVAAQSKLCDALSTSTGAERAKAAIADRYKNAQHGWHNPVDRAAGSYYNGYLNGVGDTLRLLDITIPGINAPEKEGDKA